jgi:uncharacterized membrane protein
MMGLIGGFIANMLGSGKATDTAIDAIRKIGGLEEMSGKEKAQFTLDYMNATKHQSPMRRFIAFITVSVWALLILTWLVSAGVGYSFGFGEAINYAGTVKVFMNDVLMQPYNIILGFYFAMGVVTNLRK